MIQLHQIVKDQIPDISTVQKYFLIQIRKKKIAEKVLNEINKKLGGKVVTKISKEKNYCKAEEYHQKYFQKKAKK